MEEQTRIYYIKTVVHPGEYFIEMIVVSKHQRLLVANRDKKIEGQLSNDHQEP